MKRRRTTDAGGNADGAQATHAEEVSAVTLATKGESYSPRHWPEEVVRAVINAGLVKAGAVRPAEPRRPLLNVGH